MRRILNETWLCVLISLLGIVLGTLSGYHADQADSQSVFLLITEQSDRSFLSCAFAVLKLPAVLVLSACSFIGIGVIPLLLFCRIFRMSYTAVLLFRFSPYQPAALYAVTVSLTFPAVLLLAVGGITLSRKIFSVIFRQAEPFRPSGLGKPVVCCAVLLGLAVLLEYYLTPYLLTLCQ